MPTFEFQGRDASGKAITGKRLAYSKDNIGFQLMKEGITPIHIEQVTERSNLWKVLSGLFHGGRVTTDDMGMFARQMATLSKSGVPITSAIKRLAETSRSPAMTEALNGVAEALESGVDLAGSMQRFPKIFTPLMVSMMRVGQSTGKLDEAFGRLSQYIELESSAMKEIAGAMRYPMLIGLTIVVAVVIVNAFVIPKFAAIFEQANIPLPIFTVILIGISRFFSQYWVYISIFLATAIGSLIYYLRTPEGRLQWDEYQLKLPLIGSILKRVILLRFAQMFSVVMNAGVPLLEALTLVSQALNNTYAQHELLLMHDSIQRGNSLTQAAMATDLFTTFEIQMLAVSEETGELGEMMQQIGNFYQQEVSYDLKRFNDFLEPLLLVALSLIVLMLAFAVYLPIWDMIKMAHT